MGFVLLFIIIFVIPEETLEAMLGWILGTGYGLVVVALIIAVLYGIYSFGSDLINELTNKPKK